MRNTKRLQSLAFRLSAALLRIPEHATPVRSLRNSCKVCNTQSRTHLRSDRACVVLSDRDLPRSVYQPVPISDAAAPMRIFNGAIPARFRSKQKLLQVCIFRGGPHDLQRGFTPGPLAHLVLGDFWGIGFPQSDTARYSPSYNVLRCVMMSLSYSVTLFTCRSVFHRITKALHGHLRPRSMVRCVSLRDR